MTETDQLNRMGGVGQGEESPGRPPGRPMRQLEFSQAMSDFCYMFPETDEEVIEAVLRANNGMVDATIDQLLTMNIDADVNDDDDLSDKVLLSLERDVQQQQLNMAHGSQNASGGLPVHQASSRRSGRESKSSSRKSASGETSEKMLASSKDSEDCPPSYTEAVQSHVPHHHRSNGSRSRHRHSPTIGGSHPSRQALSTMQHLLDLGPDTAPSATAASNGGSPLGAPKSHSRDQSWSSFPSHHHHHHHFPRTSTSLNHYRRRWAGTENNGEKSSRPGRNLLASSGHHHHHHHMSPHHHHHEHVTGDSWDESCGVRSQNRKGSLEANDFSVPSVDNGHGGKAHEKSPHRWRSSHRGECSSSKRPAYRNWNPPLLGTLPDDFLRISPSLPNRQSKHGTHLHRTMSAVGPESRHFYPSSPSSLPTMESGGGGANHHSRFRSSASQRPHRSLSFAGNTAQARGSQHEFSPDLLQERMKENERRRRMTSIDLDPALAMYLEDERLALMLQNSEFLQELRGDRMFMLTLERDQKTGDLERLKREPSPEAPHSLTYDDDNQDFIEGYGDDRSSTLEAFPFSQQSSAPVSEDVELRKKLKNMGKASRKQFAALARKFFSKRRKKTAQQILRGTQAPSMVNLLDEDEDDIEENAVADDEHGVDSYNRTNNTQDESVTNSQGSPQPRRQFDVV